MLPFYGAVGPEKLGSVEASVEPAAGIAVDQLAPPPRDRTTAPIKTAAIPTERSADNLRATRPDSAAQRKGSTSDTSATRKRAADHKSGDRGVLRGSAIGGSWGTRVHRERLNGSLFD
jgi:hypothetical protein